MEVEVGGGGGGQGGGVGGFAQGHGDGGSGSGIAGGGGSHAFPAGDTVIDVDGPEGDGVGMVTAIGLAEGGSGMADGP